MNKRKEANRAFKLSESPEAYIVSLHVRNLINTYGQETVQKIINELFLSNATKGKRKVG
jgi:hypothetical protein